MQSLQRLKEKALGRQIVSVNAFVSSSFQVVAIKTDRKKANARMASVRVIRGRFGFFQRRDEIADWRNGRMRNCRSQVHSLRCLSMKAEHHCHPTWCIIYFVHLTNPTTLGQSTTCRKQIEKQWVSISQEGSIFPYLIMTISVINMLYGRGYWPLWGRWYHSGAHRPLPLLSAWVQWKCLIADFKNVNSHIWHL